MNSTAPTEIESNSMHSLRQKCVSGLMVWLINSDDFRAEYEELRQLTHRMTIQSLPELEEDKPDWELERQIERTFEVMVDEAPLAALREALEAEDGLLNLYGALRREYLPSTEGNHYGPNSE
ncbi:MAG: hypothetical protein JNJ83_23310 [Verrucomicrobiaceae bacterium]|nr:hypothetical protein [Verrucomicrobiaceae bacterium]